MVLGQIQGRNRKKEGVLVLGRCLSGLGSRSTMFSPKSERTGPPVGSRPHSTRTARRVRRGMCVANTGRDRRGAWRHDRMSMNAAGNRLHRV